MFGVGILDGTHAEKRVHRVVHARLVAVVIPVEPPLVLPAEAAVGEDPRQRLGRPQPIAERRVHHGAGLLGDVEAHLVEQRDRPDREAPPCHGAVDDLDRHPFGEQDGGLVQIGRQDPVHPEPGMIRDHDHGLAHPAAEPHRRHDRLRVGRVGGDDLEQRHLFDRREEVHAQHALGPRVPRRRCHGSEWWTCCSRRWSRGA